MKSIRSFSVAFLLLAAMSCGGRKSAAPVLRDRAFPQPTVPTAYTEPGERMDYLTAHYWDGFFAGDGRTDSARVLGVAKGDVEQAFANYLAVLDAVPLPNAQTGMERFFDNISAKQQADTSARVYLAMTEIVSRYLYDPNSPMRDEDLYLPFVRKMASSPLTRDDMRRAYEYEAQMCAMNPRGSVAPDFAISLRNGKKLDMHSVKAEKTLLFFSNPGCHNCLEIIETLKADPTVTSLVREGRLAILNVYIDEDLQAWRDYMAVYPAEWINGYDAAHIIREDVLYCVRAIPSLYLLDADKRVLLKDPPVERVLKSL